MTEKLIPEQPASSSEEQRKRMERITFFETHDCPVFVQDNPLDAAAVYREFTEQYEAAAERYYEKRVEMTGVVRKIGPDIHNKPSITNILSRGERFTMQERHHTHVFEWLAFERLQNEYFYPLFLKKEIFCLPKVFTIRTEFE